MSKCPHCKFDVPSDATYCGHCGNEIPQSNFVAIVVTIVLVLLFLGVFS